MSLLHRVSAIALSLTLIAVNATMCAGWAATPEARLACCSAGGGCPMHEARSHESNPTPTATQSHADDCCAASERRRTDRPDFTVGAVFSAATLTSVIGLAGCVPALDVTDRWRRTAPLSLGAVPRHVLLSVFLV
jgi:hypothetical protein